MKLILSESELWAIKRAVKAAPDETMRGKREAILTQINRALDFNRELKRTCPEYARYLGGKS
jgi:hypothetical protein